MRINVPGYDPLADPAFLVNPNVSAGVATAQIDYAICANLLNLPDRTSPGGSSLTPEIAAGLPKVSPDGRTYTFTIRRDYHFWTGTRVTPEDVEASMNRLFALDPFTTDAYYSDVIGAEDVAHGRARTASGLLVRGNRFIVKLDRRDGALPAKLAGSSCVLPRTTPVDRPDPTPITAGPYYVASRVPGRQLVLKRNPYYRGPRPHHIDSFVLATNLDPEQSLREVKANQADMAPIDVKQGFDAAQASRYARLYGTNKGRFRVDPDYFVWFLPLNNSRGPFKSLAARKAVNLVIDRRAMARAVAGPLWGTPADQILPVGVPGYRPLHVYPLRHPDVRQANAILRRAHKRCGTVTVNVARLPDGDRTAQVVKRDLSRIHCRVRLVAGGGNMLGYRSAPFDTFTDVGWVPDYLDPYGVLNVTLSGRVIDTLHTNFALFDNARVNRLLDHASRLKGRRRIQAYARLDALITKSYAPWAVWANQNQLTFLSTRVHGYVFKYSVGGPDLAAMWLRR